jgi:hypothetical protein
MNFLKQLENAPRNLILYTLGLVGGVVDDYTLITLTAFSVLLGFAVGSVLIGLTAFFGGYFLLRMVSHITDVIGYHARVQGQNAQATMQVAAALAQFRSPETQTPEETDVERMD